MQLQKLTVDQVSLKGRRVVMRVDFNVPQDKKTGAIKNDARIVAALPTIRYVLEQGATSLVLLSHLGRPDGERVDRLTLAPVAAHLGTLLGREVRLLGGLGEEVKPGEVCLMENVRFWLAEEGKVKLEGGGKREASKEEVEAFRKGLEAYGDVYVNDAFGTAHRAHSSMMLNLPERAAGFLLKKELDYFARVMDSPARPFLAILGGAKVNDKIKLIDSLLDRVNEMVIGGGMAYTFKRVLGNMEIGSSLYDEEGAALVPGIVAKAKERGVTLHLPIDHVCADKFASDATTRVVTDADQIPQGWMGMDVGPASRAIFKQAVERAHTVVWNGPLGVFEWDAFSQGTRQVMDAIVARTAKGELVSVVGGGDTATAAANWGLEEGLSHVSTGGGASLELLEGKELPGVAHLSPPAQ